MTDRQIDNRMNKLVELDEQKKALEAEIEKLKAEMQAEMGESETIETDNFLIRWTHTVTNRFDSKAFQKDHAKLYTAYCKPQAGRRFSYAAVV